MIPELVVREPDAEAAAQRTATELAALIGEALASRGAAHLAVSGGRTPDRAYALLGALVPDWSAVHIWFADERCVAPEDPQSNARLLRETLVAPGAKVHRIAGELGAEAAAAAYERELGEIVLDVVLLGLGEDGHTASLFPANAALDAGPRTRVAPVHDAPKPPADRVTLTRTTIDRARRRILLATGPGKAAALAAALGDPTPDVPSSLLDGAGLTVIADREALGS